MPPVSRIEKDCVRIGVKLTPQRRVIARVLTAATDHPDVEELWRRAVKIDSHISIATVYRTVRLFEASDVLKRHDFGDGRARYERAPDVHHDHLIDVRSGRVIEFQNKAIEVLQEKTARRHGFRLIGHRLELYCVPLEAATKKRDPA